MAMSDEIDVERLEELLELNKECGVKQHNRNNNDD